MLDKRLLRACAIPCIVSIAAIALGGVVGITSQSDPADPHRVFAAETAETGAPSAVTSATQTGSPNLAPTAEPTREPLELKPPAEPRDQPQEEAPAAADVAPDAPAEEASSPQSIFDNNQVVVYYGNPAQPLMGVLGVYPPQEMVERLKDQARVYDDLNGDRNVVAAMDLVHGVVQSEPMSNGLYMAYMSDEHVEEYIRLAEENDLQLILDMQIGRSTVAAEVQKLEKWLLNPRVHVGIDPEYAVGPNGIPIHTPGVISGHDINAAQLYLQELAEKHNLPPKMLVVHQFMDGTIVEGEATVDLPNVDLVLNMDGDGGWSDKAEKYRRYAAQPYAQYDAFNLFIKQDEPMGTEGDVLSLDPVPDMIFYQ